MTPNSKKPLRPEDFPVDVEGQKIKEAGRYSHRRCGESRRRFEIVERLNEDEARREEDKWSA